LLITSVGSLVGQNILDGLAPWRDDYFIIGLNSQADAVSNFLCNRTYLSAPLAQGSSFEKRLDEVASMEAPDLIVPGRDDDVVFLATWAGKLANSRFNAMVGSAELARVLRDKLLTSRFAARHGLPFAETLCAQDGFTAVLSLGERHGWPLVAKPRMGSASQGVVLISSPDELAVAFEWEGYCFQQWIGPNPDLVALRNVLKGGVPLGWTLPGIQYLGLHGCIAPDGSKSQLFCTRHTESRLGRSERVHSLQSQVTQEILERYASALVSDGWRGPFNIQLGETPGGDLLAFEINGRFSGSSATLGALGMHFVPLAIASFVGGAGLQIDSPAVVSRVDKRLRDWPLSGSAVGTLAQRGVWTRDQE
jgi:carbamoyl-phosphate synthase large subunit